MQFIAVIRRRIEAFSQEEFDKYLEAEAELIRAKYIEGTVRAIWSRSDVLGAVLMLELPAIEDAEKFVAELPLMQHDMLECQMLVPMRGYRGFAPRS